MRFGRIVEKLVDRAYREVRRAGRNGDLGGVRRSLEILLMLQKRIPPGHEAHPWARSCLAEGLDVHFELTGDPEVLDAAVEVYREVIAAEEELGEPRVEIGFYLLHDLRLRYELTGRPEDLAEAEELASRPVPAEWSAHADLMKGLVLLHKAERSGVQETLDEAVLLLEKARASGPEGVSEAARDSLAGALCHRGVITGSSADYVRAAELLREAVSTGTPDPRTLADYVTALLGWFDSTRDPELLTRAQEAVERALRLTPEESPQRNQVLFAAIGVGKTRFSHTGDRADLDRAISLARTALDRMPPGYRERGKALAELGDMLLIRHRVFEAEPDLRYALALFAEALPELENDPAHRPLLLKRYAMAFITLHLQDGSVEHLEKAMRVLEPALDVSGRYRGTVIGTYGLLTFLRAGAEADPELEESALRIFAEAAEADPAWYGHRSRWGMALVRRYARSGDPADLDEAITRLSGALEDVDRADPHLGILALSLGEALLLRAERTADPDDRERALAAYRTAVSCTTAPAEQRATVARRLAEAEAVSGRYTVALEEYGNALDLLDLAAWRGLPPDDAERLLARFSTLAVDAAACAIAAGEPVRAVELLEQGRGVLLGQALEARADYEEARRLAPAQVERLTEVLRGLEAPVTVLSPAEAVEENERRLRLSRERDELLLALRRIEGLERLLLPPRFADLQPPAGSGPIVIVNVSALRSDALLVTAEGVRVVPLSAGLSAEVPERVDALLEAPQQDAVLADLLEWLWTEVCRKVLAEIPDATRVWWCPTGLLTLLPLHAAGRTLDRVVSSYTPTLRLLARTRAARPGAGGGGVLQVVPRTPGEQPLPGAERELPVKVPVRRLAGPEAGAEALLETLPGYSWLHFAGHGEQDLEHPSRGRLLLHDGPVTVRDISRSRLDGADVAFLGGCETARGGGALADEAITLTTAMRLAGFRHAIGTLWEIPDPVAARFTRAFYREAARPDGSLDPERAAAALHTATLGLRSMFGPHPSAWAGFVHSGP